MWKVFYPDTWFIDFSSVTNTPCAAWPPALPFVSVVHPSTHCPLLSAGEVPVCQHHLLPEPPAAKLQHPQEPDDPAHTSKFNSLWLVQVNKAQQLQIDRPTSPQWTCIPPLSARKPIQKNIFPQRKTIKWLKKKCLRWFNSNLFTNETQTLLQSHREPVVGKCLYITYQSQSCTPLISSERTLCGRGSRHRDEPCGEGRKWRGGVLRCGAWDVSQGKAARRAVGNRE